MIKIINYSNGELLITNGQQQLRLPREAANRLILFARMHTVSDFVEGLPKLIAEPNMVQALRVIFDSARTSSERWNLKEKFARLTTLAKEYEPSTGPTVVEELDF